MLHSCANCKKHDATFRCSACQLPYYCNTLCQSSHWKSVHKKQCKFFRKNTKSKYELEAFVKLIEANHVTLDEAAPQTTKEENKVFNKHNQTIQSLLYFAKKIQRSDTLSSNGKLSKLGKIVNAISTFHDSISSGLHTIPSQLFSNNDESLLLKSSLTEYSPAKDLINQIVSDIHFKRLKLDDAMNVMHYTMTHNINNHTLQSIIDGINFALNNIDLKSAVFGLNNVPKNKELETSEIGKISHFINSDYFKQNASNVRPDLCSDLVRFDSGYKVRQYYELLMHGYIRRILARMIPMEIVRLCQKYCGNFISDSVYGARLKVTTEYKFDDSSDSYHMIGCHYGSTWNMDCAGNLFAYTGCLGYKGRACEIDEFVFNPSNKYQMERVRSWRGFASPSDMIFCDNIHDTFWVAGDSRIKCSGYIENGKDTNYEEYELSCDHILDHSGIKGSKTLLVTEEKAFVYSDNGTFYVWDLEKLNDHCTDYCCESHDDSIPEKDEYGISTKMYSVLDAAMGESGTLEVSGGQAYMDSFEIDTQNINGIQLRGSEISICHNMNKFDGSIFIANENVIYKYNMEKNTISDAFVGHTTGSVHLPFRQYLLSDNLMVSHDSGLAKVWDLRMKEAIYSIQGSGNYKLMAAIGFGHNYIATGGGNEAVIIWDLRHRSALYEMSSGNNMIKQFVWHKRSASLIAASDTGLYSSYWGNGRSDYEEVKWPKDAVHKRDDFPKELDSNYNDIFVYKFDGKQ